VGEVFVGIDVSKARLDVAVRPSNGSYTIEGGGGGGGGGVLNVP